MFCICFIVRCLTIVDRIISLCICIRINWALKSKQKRKTLDELNCKKRIVRLFYSKSSEMFTWYVLHDFKPSNCRILCCVRDLNPNIRSNHSLTHTNLTVRDLELYLKKFNLFHFLLFNNGIDFVHNNTKAVNTFWHFWNWSLAFLKLVRLIGSVLWLDRAHTSTIQIGSIYRNSSWREKNQMFHNGTNSFVSPQKSEWNFY